VKVEQAELLFHFLDPLAIEIAVFTGIEEATIGFQSGFHLAAAFMSYLLA
jgi:hypothetical protein